MGQTWYPIVSGYPSLRFVIVSAACLLTALGCAALRFHSWKNRRRRLLLRTADERVLVIAAVIFVALGVGLLILGFRAPDWRASVEHSYDVTALDTTEVSHSPRVRVASGDGPSQWCRVVINQADGRTFRLECDTPVRPR